MTKYIVIRIGIICAVVVVGLSFIFIERNLSLTIARLDTQIKDTNQSIENLTQTIHLLSGIQEELVVAVADLQEESGLTEETITSIRTGIEEKREQEQAQEITTLVNAWKHRIARIECTHNKENGDVITAKSSGVLMYIGNTLHVMTNKHVLDKDDRVLKACSIMFPQINEDEIDIPLYAITKSEERDLAYLRIDDPKIRMPFDNTQNACMENPHVGDRVITLGFPKVGAEESVTVTEGIISGIEDDYYVTSAKIEEGNSGGAAILTKNNCFVGIPTLVIVGRVESLARILPINSLSRMNL